MFKKQLAKALSLSCCVEVYQSWSNQCLREAASQSLPTSLDLSESDVPGNSFHSRVRAGWHQNLNSVLLVVQGGSEAASLCVAMAGIHESACRYASVLLGAQPFSPQTYMEFISYFGHLCYHLHKQWQSKANRYFKSLKIIITVACTY